MAQTQHLYEDDLPVIEGGWLNTDIATQTTTLVLTGAGLFGGIDYLVAAAGTVLVYDGVDATGTLIKTYAASLTPGSYPGRPIAVGTGICVVTGAAVGISVFHRAA